MREVVVGGGAMIPFGIYPQRGNSGGGLVAWVHPVGATGVAQVVEVVRQLQGRCGDRRVEDSRDGLPHATDGGLSGLDYGASAIRVFESTLIQ